MRLGRVADAPGRVKALVVHLWLSALGLMSGLSAHIPAAIAVALRGSTFTSRDVNGSLTQSVQAANLTVQACGVFDVSTKGASVLLLDGTSKISGVFAVQGGVLRLSSAGAFTSNGNLWIDGGVVELGAGNSSFLKVVESGANQIRLSGGGFGAVGADANVNLGASV